jgi:signal transduction histidine kinase
MSFGKIRRSILGRHSVRARIALACAGLFLVTGALFVTATYQLIEHSLGPSTSRHIPAALIPLCKKADGNPDLKASSALLDQCQYFLGATNQRITDLHEVLVWSLAGLAVGTVVAGILGWAIGRRILLPLRKLTVAAQRASTEHLDERIRLDGPQDELKQLSDTFDDMLDRLDRAFVSQRRFVANASHELRTPLTSMRTLIDVAMAKPERTTDQLETLVGRVRTALDQAESLINGLLTLARSDRGVTSRQLVDLEAAAQDAIDQVESTARSAEIAFEADLSPSPTIGDRVLLERLVANLVDNAVHYNRPGGSVTVLAGSDHDESYITVTNTGPTVPASLVDSLFEPFTRLDGRAGNGQGVGLGLSIVASVVKAHRGRLIATALPNGGMNISVRLPHSDVGAEHATPGKVLK